MLMLCILKQKPKTKTYSYDNRNMITELEIGKQENTYWVYSELEWIYSP
jgi:hypothetical protein